MKYRIRLNGKVYEVEAEQGAAQLLSEYDDIGCVTPPAVMPSVPTAAPAPVASSAAPAVDKAQAGGKRIEAPLPGTVVSVKVQTGQQIHKGDVVAVIESMKMENDIVATVEGIVTAVLVTRGAQTQAGDPIVILS